MRLTRGITIGGAIAFPIFLISIGVIAPVNRLKLSSSREMPAQAVAEDGRAGQPLPALTAKNQERAPVAPLSAEPPNWTARTKAVTLHWEAAIAPNGITDTLWNHDGSTVRLEAIGRARRFYIAGLRRGSAAKAGDPVFEGVREGPAFSGVAFLYSEKCPHLAYQVRGSVSPDETTIKLRGSRPSYDVQCKIVGYTADELEFRLAGKL